ncbi:MAG: CDP-alcohol phosphatidyltransferase family protein [Gammaproteobacteria bacterium]
MILRTYIPNILSVLRLLTVPLLIFFSYKGYPTIFLALLTFSFITDALDGAIARKFNLQSSLGAKLDSVADFAVYLAIPVCAWLLWPEVIWQEKFYVAAVVCSIVLPVLIGLLKFGSYTSYHTWLTKIAAVFMAISSIVLFLGGTVWLFHIAVVVCVLASLEEILITFLLTEAKSDVGSLWRVIKRHYRKHV